MFRNGNILSQILTTVTRKYPRMEASLMVSLSVMIKLISARCPEVRSHSNHKLHYVLKHYSYTFVMKQLTQLVRLSDEGTFKRALAVELNALAISLQSCHFCIACSWNNSDRNCTFHNFCQVGCDWDNLVNGIFLPHKLQGVFTGVSELMHFVLNMTH